MSLGKILPADLSATRDTKELSPIELGISDPIQRALYRMEQRDPSVGEGELASRWHVFRKLVNGTFPGYRDIWTKGTDATRFMNTYYNGRAGYRILDMDGLLCCDASEELLGLQSRLFETEREENRSTANDTIWLIEPFQVLQKYADTDFFVGEVTTPSKSLRLLDDLRVEKFDKPLTYVDSLERISHRAEQIARTIHDCMRADWDIPENLWKAYRNSINLYRTVGNELAVAYGLEGLNSLSLDPLSDGDREGIAKTGRRIMNTAGLVSSAFKREAYKMKFAVQNSQDPAKAAEKIEDYRREVRERNDQLISDYNRIGTVVARASIPRGSMYLINPHYTFEKTLINKDSLSLDPLYLINNKRALAV